MIIEQKINGLLFQEQRTYRIYRSEEDRTNGVVVLVTSEESLFLRNIKLAKAKEKKGDKENKFFVFP